jgi:hypothetical protein
MVERLEGRSEHFDRPLGGRAPERERHSLRFDQPFAVAPPALDVGETLRTVETPLYSPAGTVRES